jgi:Pyridoxamine 5'-phosphate oxidase
VHDERTCYRAQSWLQLRWCFGDTLAKSGCGAQAGGDPLDLDVCANGRPHVRPLPAMWLDGALHFGTGLDEQTGRNIGRNPNCILTTGTNSYWQGLDVVVEGRLTSPTGSAVSG